MSTNGGMFTAQVIPNHPVAGESVFLEGPEGQRRLISLHGGSTEQIAFRYPGIDGPVEVIYPHNDFDHLVSDPTGAGSAVLAPISNRANHGNIYVICAGCETEVEKFELPLNFPTDNPINSIHGNAKDMKLELMELSGPSKNLAYATLKYVTTENGYGGYPAGVEFILKYCLYGGRSSDIIAIWNKSSKPISPSTGFHTSVLPGFVSDGQNTPIGDLLLKVDSECILELDNDFNVTGQMINFDDTSDPTIPQYDLRGGRGVRIGEKSFDHVYRLSGGGKMRVLDPTKGVGVQTQCNENFYHGTVWTNGNGRKFVALEPNVHAGVYSTPAIAAAIGQRCIKPGESRTYRADMTPITKFVSGHGR